MQARFKLAVLKKSILFSIVLSALISTQVMAQTCGTTNLAQFRNVFASAGPSWSPPANLVDTLLTTNPWSPNVAGAQWAYVALDQQYNICRVVVSWTRWNYADFKIQGTNTDPSTGTPTWTDLATVTGNNPTAGTIPGTSTAYSYNDLSIANTSVTFKYIRLYLPSATTSTQALELQIYSRSGNLPPTISITAPANNASFVQGANITFTANASDPDGNVTKVEFFNGATLLGTITTAPYLYVWNNVAIGTYTINAKATDDGGSSTTATITISVTAPSSTGAWSVTGNAGITPATQFLGTTDAQPLIIKTSGTERARFDNTGALLIGTANLPILNPNDPNVKLAVKGTIAAMKLQVTQSTWSDFVFAKNYQLPSLAAIEAYIKKHERLPGVASAKEVTTNGLDVGNNQAVLLQKIEELTLYVIELNKKIEKQQVQILKQNKRLNANQSGNNKVRKPKK